MDYEQGHISWRLIGESLSGTVAHSPRQIPGSAIPPAELLREQREEHAQWEGMAWVVWAMLVIHHINPLGHCTPFFVSFSYGFLTANSIREAQEQCHNGQLSGLFFVPTPVVKAVRGTSLNRASFIHLDARLRSGDNLANAGMSQPTWC